MVKIIDLIFPKNCLLCRQKGKYMCTNCIDKLPSAPYKKGVIITLPYRGIVRKAITALKYKFAFDIAGEISDLTIRSIRKNHLNLPKKAILVPIPLHSQKERYRGFNQVEKIGRLLAAKLDWGFESNLLERAVQSKNQAYLTGEERRKNVKGVFGINPKCKTSSINTPIILLDDVYTTGSTMNEAFSVLKGAGYKRVYPLSISG